MLKRHREHISERGEKSHHNLKMTFSSMSLALYLCKFTKGDQLYLTKIIVKPNQFNQQYVTVSRACVRILEPRVPSKNVADIIQHQTNRKVKGPWINLKMVFSNLTNLSIALYLLSRPIKFQWFFAWPVRKSLGGKKERPSR